MQAALQSDWRFGGEELARVRRICRLQRDFEANHAKRGRDAAVDRRNRAPACATSARRCRRVLSCGGLRSAASGTQNWRARRGPCISTRSYFSATRAIWAAATQALPVGRTQGMARRGKLLPPMATRLVRASSLRWSSCERDHPHTTCGVPPVSGPGEDDRCVRLEHFVLARHFGSTGWGRCDNAQWCGQTCFHDDASSARGLSKVYRSGEVEVHALRDIDMEIRRGEFVLLLGASAAANRRYSTSWAGRMCRQAAKCASATRC